MENVLQEADIAMCISNSEGNSDCCIRLAEHYHVKGVITNWATRSPFSTL